MRRALLFVVTGAVLAATVVGLSAQKVKPAPAPTYIWDALLPGEFDMGQNVYGPGVALQHGGNVNVFVSYVAPTSKAIGYSQFIFRVWHADWEENQWIGFKDILPGTNNRTPTCGFPTFVNGVIDPGALVDHSPACIVEFLSGHKHPQGPYWNGSIVLRVPNVDVFAVANGGSRTVSSGQLNVYVSVQDNAAEDAYSGVTYAGNVYSAGTVTIERSADGNSWVTTADLPVGLGELYYDKDRRGTLQPVVPAITTTIFHSTVTWTRRVQ
jgi:hypothetical protein